jgi:hypothetical protein
VDRVNDEVAAAEQHTRHANQKDQGHGRLLRLLPPMQNAMAFYVA